jgi:hypothetical protein
MIPQPNKKSAGTSGHSALSFDRAIKSIILVALLSWRPVAVVQLWVVRPHYTLMKNTVASILALLCMIGPGFAQEQAIPAFRILPEDVVHDNIHPFRFNTNSFAVRWTFTEAGSNKILAFNETHKGQKTCTAIGSFTTPPSVWNVGTNYSQWKDGWLKHRTDAMFCETEDDQKAIIAGLEDK